MKKESIKFIEAEIEWCKKNKKSNPNSKEWFKGYIDGLKQSINLIKMFK